MSSATFEIVNYKKNIMKATNAKDTAKQRPQHLKEKR